MMSFLPKPRIFGVGLLVALALLTAGFSFAVAAQSQPALFVMAPDADTCDLVNLDKPMVIQGAKFAIDVRGMTASEPVAISLTFPDGRVYSPTVAQIDGQNGLDGVLNLPPDPGFFGQSNPGGDYVSFFQTTSKWPHGCYKVTA
ncbi:MAG: hypothetical protein HGA19_14720, partial [Oscillochloris sp.]|nr:hypothetical protein [Oscillochloris sp.]